VEMGIEKPKRWMRARCLLTKSECRLPVNRLMFLHRD